MAIRIGRLPRIVPIRWMSFLRLMAMDLDSVGHFGNRCNRPSAAATWCICIHCGHLPASLRSEFLSQHPQLRNKSVILFLGRMHPKKGLDLLIPAFEILNRQHSQTHLLIVGPGEPEYVASIREEISCRHLDGQVTLTGRLS